MYTLQVLDGGQTFLRPLENRPLVLGSAPDTDLRLQGAAVAERHARIDTGPDGVAIVAIAGAPVRVNGALVARADLQLGDRIEIGSAVIVVGRSVTRQATPDDVLADAWDAGRSRSGRGRRGGGVGRWLAIAGGTVLLGVAVTMMALAEKNEPPPVHQVTNLRKSGRFADARTELQRVLQVWAGDDAGRREVIEREGQMVAAVEQAVAVRRERLMQEAAVATAAQLNLTLQREERGDGPLAEREAARIIRGSLEEWLRATPLPASPAQVADAGGGQGPPGGTAGEGRADIAEAATEVTTGSTALTASAGPALDLAVLAEEALGLSGSGLHLQALDMLQAALAQVDASSAVPLRAALATVRAQTRASLDAALRLGSELEGRDGPAAALQFLEERARTLPSHGDFAALAETVAALRGRRTAAATAMAAAPKGAMSAGQPSAPVSEATRRATLQDLRVLLEEIRNGESQGDYARVVGLLEQGAATVLSRDAEFARRLSDKAADFALLAGLHESVRETVAKGRRLPVRLRNGRQAEVIGVDGSRLIVATVEGDRPVTWSDVEAGTVTDLVRQGRLPLGAAAGAAVMAYRDGARDAAETLLAHALRADARLQPVIDGVVARGRGEVGTGGFVLEKDGFVAATTVAARKVAGKLQTRIKGALREGGGPRKSLVEDMLAQGPSGLEAMVLAFQREFLAQLEVVAKLPLRKQVDKLAEQRVAMDQARQYALDLIYDEQNYFYPYKPPAVSSDRFAEYNRVQADVDRRVAAVRGIWNDQRLRVNVPSSVNQEIERVDWLASVLRDLGELDRSQLAQIDWARALPAGGRVTLREYCATSAERSEMDRWQRVEGFNERALQMLNSAEREEFIITNEYRRMFRHRPLAVNPKLHTAARGHAEEMGRLGYFSHFSPTPGHKTPYERMKLAGYSAGVSENIATNGSAPGAHDAWLHSSGHHRNLLNASHTEFGIGSDGRNWVQNFGHGREYEEDERFPGRR